MRIVYVLGAGTSVAAGAPLMKDFKDVAASISAVVENSRGRERLDEALRFWNYKVPSANIEEFYILADLLHRLGIIVAEFEGLSYPLDESVRYLIAKTLQIKMETSVSKVHQDFIEKSRQSTGDDISVISLNWDIALDRAIMRAYGDGAIDYGLPAKPLDGQPRDQGSPRFRILKIHGSTNWWFCEKCGTLWYDTQRKAIHEYWEKDEPLLCVENTCPGKLVPLMVPPTSQKFDSKEFAAVLATLWTAARTEISKCDRLAFVGYSFPPTDIQFKMLVQEALSTNKGLGTLSVISYPKFGFDKLEFEAHYSEMLQGSKFHSRLTFRYCDFKNWVEEQNLALF